MSVFVPTAYQLATFEPRYDADGKVFLQAVAHGTLTAKTCYQIIANEYGPVTKAVTDETYYCYIGVPLAAVASGAAAWLQWGGYIVDMICTSGNHTVGHGIEKHDATIATTGADYTGGDASFAVATEDGTTVTDICAMLVPRLILGST